MRVGERVNKLDKFDYFMITAVLSLKGFEFKEETRFCCEIWHDNKTKKYFEIKRNSKNIAKEDLLNVLNQAGISLDEFIELI